MEGNSVDQLLVPESGQTTTPASNPAPEPKSEPGQGVLEPPASTTTGGQGEPQQPEPDEEMIPISRYKELQGAFTKKAMELAQLKRAPSVPEAPATPQYVPQAPAAQPNTIAALVQNMVQEQLAQAVAPIQQQQQDLRIKSKIMELSGNKDFGDVAQTFVDMLDENPELLDLENGLDIAFNAARSSVLERKIEARVQAELQASKQVTASKIANNETAPNAKGPAPGAGQTDADAIRQSILDVGGRHPIFG